MAKDLNTQGKILEESRGNCVLGGGKDFFQSAQKAQTTTVSSTTSRTRISVHQDTPFRKRKGKPRIGK